MISPSKSVLSKQLNANNLLISENKMAANITCSHAFITGNKFIYLKNIVTNKTNIFLRHLINV